MGSCYDSMEIAWRKQYYKIVSWWNVGGMV